MSRDTGQSYPGHERITEAGSPDFRASEILPPAPPGYILVELIHRGGQGSVYRALQLSTQRHVALKVLASGVHATDRERRRFEREIELVASLDHPGIVGIIDSGEHAGQPWFAMRLVEGVTLDVHLADARPDLAARLRLFMGACEAVHHAHQRGVLHRDLKPANIMVDTESRPCVLDFGLGRLLDTKESVTHAGIFAGTWSHASPEQVRGETDRLDVRTDVYSLGVVLYEMLTGSHPHPGATGLAELLQAITNEEPKRPSAIVRGLDRDLDTIVLKALAKDRDRRYASVDALREDVARFLRAEPIGARTETLYLLRKSARRHRIALGALVAILTVLLGSLVVFARERDAAIAAQNAAIEEAQRRAAEANASTQMSEFLLSIVEEAGQSSGRTSPTELADLMASRIDEMKELPAAQARIMSALARTYQTVGRFDEALVFARRTLAMRVRSLGNEPVDVAESLNCLGVIHQKLGHFTQSENYLRRALAMRRRALGNDSPDTGSTVCSLGVAVALGGKPALAKPMFEEALRIARLHPIAKSRNLTMSLINLADVEWDLGNLDEAEARFRELIVLRQSVGDDAHGLSRSHLDLGRVLLARGRPADAEREYALAREFASRSSTGRATDPVRTATLGLARAISAEGRHAEARVLFDEVTRLTEHIFGTDARPMVQVLEFDAVARRSAGELREALALHERSVALHEALYTRSDPRTAAALMSWSRTLAAAGRLRESEARRAEAVAIQRECLPESTDPELLHLAMASIAPAREHHSVGSVAALAR